MRELAHAAGTQGMCGGQAIDLAAVGQTLALPELERMHRMKTGALLRAAVLMGALSGQATLLTESTREALARYGEAIGLAFQVVDDMPMSKPAPRRSARPPARMPRIASRPMCRCWDSRPLVR
jgi:farnesyl diphosphate synthase